LEPTLSSLYPLYLRRIRDCEATVLTTNLNNDNGRAAARAEELKSLADLSRTVRMEEDANMGEPSEHLGQMVKGAQQTAVDFVEKYRRH
jgi:hypothetical protein